MRGRGETGAERVIERQTHQELAARVIRRPLDDGKTAVSAVLIALLMEHLNSAVDLPCLSGMRRVSRPRRSAGYRQAAQMNDE
jgi:hypothetical protein